MSQPAVVITELDGSLGVLPPSSGRLFAVVGVASAGAIAAPATYARVKDIVAAFGAGPLVEAACHYVDRYAKPVILVRTAQTVVGTYSAVTATATGTSVVTITPSQPAYDDYEIVFRVVVGGTRGTPGITYQSSLDGGRTFGAVTALGSATQISIPGSNVGLSFAAGTLVAGDFYTARSVAPLWNATDIGAALDALGASAASWELVHVVGPVDATSFPVIDGKIAGFKAAGKYHAWIGSVRVPTIAESEAAYLTSISGVFAALSTVDGMLCAGACKLSSAVNGRQYKRPVAFVEAAREASVSEEIDDADVNLGSLKSVVIRDVNGNVDEHDESINPGLDDAGFCVLRTWDGIPGVFVNRPRLFSPPTSDFQLLTHRRVLNLAHAALRIYFIKRLNKPVLVDKTTGFILEADRLEIEKGATVAMEAVLLAKPKASGVQFALSKTDNVLSTKTLTGTARVIPLAYPETINLDVGFFNPALQVAAV